MPINNFESETNQCAVSKQPPETVAERIRKARKDRRLTLQQLATKSGLSISRISNYEQGRRTPGIDDIKALADGLAEDPCVLSGFATSHIQNDDARTVLQVYISLNPAAKEEVMDLTLRRYREQEVRNMPRSGLQSSSSALAYDCDGQ